MADHWGSITTTLEGKMRDCPPQLITLISHGYTEATAKDYQIAATRFFQCLSTALTIKEQKKSSGSTQYRYTLDLTLLEDLFRSNYVCSTAEAWQLKNQKEELEEQNKKFLEQLNAYTQKLTALEPRIADLEQTNQQLIQQKDALEAAMHAALEDRDASKQQAAVLATKNSSQQEETACLNGVIERNKATMIELQNKRQGASTFEDEEIPSRSAWMAGGIVLGAATTYALLRYGRMLWDKLPLKNLRVVSQGH